MASDSKLHTSPGDSMLPFVPDDGDGYMTLYMC